MLHVLIVEDEKAISNLIRLSLKKEGYQCTCAFDGLDKTYTYAGVEIITYPDEERDYISSVCILDSSVSTPEGITIGSTQEDVAAAYGEDFQELGTQYVYEDGDARLSILFENGAAIYVEYTALNDLLG